MIDSPSLATAKGAEVCVGKRRTKPPRETALWPFWAVLELPCARAPSLSFFIHLVISELLVVVCEEGSCTRSEERVFKAASASFQSVGCFEETVLVESLNGMNFKVLLTWGQALAIGAIVSTHPIAANADMIIDDFENQPTGSGIGTPLDYFSFGGQLTDFGVDEKFDAVSGTRSAFYVADFSVENAFGIGAARQNLNLSLSSNHVLSVYLRVTDSLAVGSTPFTAFRIGDADGTVMRTPDSDLSSVSTDFLKISQPLSSLTFQDEAGSLAGLDFAHITTVGLLFYDRDFSGTSTIVFDDLSITAVPEPSQFSLWVMLGFLTVSYHLGVKKVSRVQAEPVPTGR